MGTNLYVADLTPERLAQVVTKLRPEAPFAILERIDNLKFPAQKTLPNILEWDKGWLFGPTLELRWERQGQVFHTVLTLRDNHSAPADFVETTKILAVGEMQEYYMWGEDDPSIGRQLIYDAIPAAGRAKLAVEEFRDPESHKLLFYRYAGMRREE